MIQQDTVRLIIDDTGKSTGQFAVVHPIPEARIIQLSVTDATTYSSIYVESQSVLWADEIEVGSISAEQDGLQWLQVHPEVWNEYAGQWVALKADGICAAGQDLQTVLDQARKKGFLEPIVFKVPTGEGTLFYANNRVPDYETL